MASRAGARNFCDSESQKLPRFSFFFTLLQLTTESFLGGRGGFWMGMREGCRYRMKSTGLVIVHLINIYPHLNSAAGYACAVNLIHCSRPSRFHLQSFPLRHPLRLCQAPLPSSFCVDYTNLGYPMLAICIKKFPNCEILHVKKIICL